MEDFLEVFIDQRVEEKHLTVLVVDEINEESREGETHDLFVLKPGRLGADTAD